MMPAARPRRPMAGVRRQFPYLVPLLAWMAVIAVLSTDVGSSSRTTDPVIRIVHRLLFPSSPPEHVQAQFELLSWVIRKSAHLSEYAILGVLACRWLRFSFHPSQLALHLAAVSLAGSYAGLDELHQLFLPSRTGAGTDILVDLAGALVGAVLFAWHRRRRAATAGGC